MSTWHVTALRGGSQTVVSRMAMLEDGEEVVVAAGGQYNPIAAGDMA